MQFICYSFFPVAYCKVFLFMPSSWLLVFCSLLLLRLLFRLCKLTNCPTSFKRPIVVHSSSCSTIQQPLLEYIGNQIDHHLQLSSISSRKLLQRNGYSGLHIIIIIIIIVFIFQIEKP